MKNVGEDSKRLIQYCMRRLQLQGNVACFGSDGVFFRIVSGKKFKIRLANFFMPGNNGSSEAKKVYEQFRCAGKKIFEIRKICKDSDEVKKDEEKIRDILKEELGPVLDRIVDRVDTNLYLSNMALECYPCWVFTMNDKVQAGKWLYSLDYMIQNIKNGTLLDALGLRDWKEEQPYFLFRLNMPSSHRLYKPTIMDADFGNKYFHPGGKTKSVTESKPVTESLEKSQYEWVVKGRPSFAMIKEVIYIERK